MVLEIHGVSKAFNGVQVVDNASLSIRSGETLAFLGPSGCGKSTLLQMVAGFVTLDSGDIRLHGESIIAKPPYRRGIGLVFQHYALFPHMTVAANIEYGLRAAQAPAADRQLRVREMVALLKLEGLERRYPGELSGGQKQRVAIARTLAVHPELLLLDEALSALDKNLREAMQIELSLLLRQLGISTIFVTHDQREAFGIADRIAVMEQGRILQVDTPETIYRQPGSGFIADFLGSSSSLNVDVRRSANGLEVVTHVGVSFCLPPGDSEPMVGRSRLILRAEEVTLSSAPTAVHQERPATVHLATFLGSTVRYVVALQDHQIVVEAPPRGGALFDVGGQVFLDFEPGRTHLVAAA